ncbi:ESX secretion-associated protein EspG [Nocardia sp. 004]|uniref:ESX secretion-associated protein EspG n=1 Tax=Nocardia sp. 004 TaxID=3385978 RepID=UPI0039A2CB28
MTEWVWEPDAFAALWYSEGIDRFPRPLRFLSKYQTRDAYDAHRARVLAALDEEQRELIRLAFHTLTEGQLRIEIRGGSTATDRGAIREYRVVGACTTDYGMALAQSTVDDIDGPVHGRLFPAEQLPRRLARLLPACPAGAQPAATFAVRDLNSRSAPEHYSRRSPREQYEALTRRPIDGGGNARLLVGHILERPAPWYSMQWVDVTGDGRYLRHRTSEHIDIRPVVAADFAAGFTTWIDHARGRLRADESSTW